MKRFDTYDLLQFDPNGGVLVMTTYWRPGVKDPDPDHPGEKLSALSYLSTESEERCPCGSGRMFADCCQPLPYWRPVCPDPDLQGYSLLHACSLTRLPLLPNYHGGRPAGDPAASEYCAAARGTRTPDF